jgi:hypothetical protein
MAKGRTKKKGNKICAAGIAWAKRTFDRYPSATWQRVSIAKTLITQKVKRKNNGKDFNICSRQ